MALHLRNMFRSPDVLENVERSLLFDWPALWRGESAMSTFGATDVAETDKEYVMTIDVPGAKKEDISINIQDGILNVSGSVASEKKEEKKNYLMRERHEGSFCRQYRLTENVDASKIDAAEKDGVLTVRLPKIKAEKPATAVPIK